MAIASVVIPAHNEASVIARCLGALLRDADGDEFEVVIVANGCVDGTASIARASAPTAVVLELAVASKTSALNAGDEVAQTFPRIYLDADVELTTRAARDLVAALRAGPALIARPPAIIDVTSSSKAVRRYHTARKLLDLGSGLVEVHGGGVYAMSAKGRSRFGKFPEVIADDLYVNWLFDGCERSIVATDPVGVYAPLNGTALTAQLRRVYQGNHQLRELFPDIAVPTTSRRARRLISQLHGPARFVPAASYVWFTTRARLQSRRSHVRWERDESSRTATERIEVIAGVPMSAITLEEAVEAILDLARSDTPNLVTTANVDHVVQLQSNVDLRAAYAASSLTVADGMPLVWLSRMRRLPLPERVTGVDLFAPLLSGARDKGYSVMILGGDERSHDLAFARAAREFPSLQLHGCSPPVGFESDPSLDSEVLGRVIDLSPQLLFLCLGCPKQELWWHRHQAQLPGGVGIGAGASLDFYAGTQKRAPAWMRRRGLEWAWRAASDRRLVKRYFGRDLHFFRIAVRDLLRPIPSIIDRKP